MTERRPGRGIRGAYARYRRGLRTRGWQRQIAKETGVSFQQVQRDLSPKVTESVTKRDSPVLRTDAPAGLAVATEIREAKRLVDSGLSQRQAAKALGVDEITVRRDVRQNAAESATKSRTPSPILRTDAPAGAAMAGAWS